MNTNNLVMKAMQQKCGAILGQEKRDEAAVKQGSGTTPAVTPKITREPIDDRVR
ncbi:MAG: hypothetical protein J4A00_09945 [Gammaproteobacteria bacterium]|nr:hypothetical protein [Gammaproteobacteria bacterium]